jgi:hypothetical protein
MILRPAVLLVAAVAFTGCGDNDTNTQRATQDARSRGPKLGDHCRTNTAIDSIVEIKTVRGPLTCGEAKTILAAYYNSLENAVGSGAGLRVDTWFCISAPPPQAPLAGNCKERSTGRRFEMYGVAPPPEPKPAPDSGPTPAPLTLAEGEEHANIFAQHVAQQADDDGFQVGPCSSISPMQVNCEVVYYAQRPTYRVSCFATIEVSAVGNEITRGHKAPPSCEPQGE